MARQALAPRLPAAPAIWQDGLAVSLLVGAVALWITLAVWLWANYRVLPDLLPLHFDAQGFPDRIGDRRELLVLPAIGLAVNLVNLLGGLWLRLRYRMVFASYLLWSGAFMIQGLLWIAMWNLTH